MQPNDPMVTLFVYKRLRFLWLCHLEEGMEGRDEGRIHTLKDVLLSQLDVLEVELRLRPDWYLIQCVVEEIEGSERQLLVAEVTRL